MSAVPQLRNLLRTKVKKDLGIGIALAIVATAVYKVTINDVRIKKYEEFHRTYDAKAHYQRMIKAGVFQSIRPDGSVTAEDWK
ncbi:cytochrome c oxidase subunit 6C-like [Haliotis rufescens]|uniref:cytochrome c oxidase subunit 6C-like n=1 Tax=Haliotis rufescens TaxID=6454 RepID=UPI001EAF93DD|nr:cytochrome c oxidase subunit 6C-like [Haliotis rufescens]